MGRKRVLEDKVCLACSKKFRPYKKSVKYCSRKCYEIGRTILKDVKCYTCGKEFKPYTKSTKYCSMKCYKYSLNSSKKEERKNKKCLTCGSMFGSRKRGSIYCSRKCAGISKKLNNINAGDKSPFWKGGKVGYNAAHDRVKKARGKPNYCEICGSTNPDKKYEWANISGNYTDINDYKRLCKTCHGKYDADKRKAEEEDK